MENMIISYLTLRKIIGILGIALAPICIIGGLVSTGIIQWSISAYYYTVMRNIFVGVLFIAGAFLLSYKGYDLADNIISGVAGLSAIGIALIPMGVSKFHFIFAGLFFISIAIMSYFQFSQGLHKQRNKIYKICGLVIIIALIFIALLKNIPYIILIGEIIMLDAFGVAWLLKGIKKRN